MMDAVAIREEIALHQIWCVSHHAIRGPRSEEYMECVTSCKETISRSRRLTAADPDSLVKHSVSSWLISCTKI